MRKRYIFWWVISALFFWNAVARFISWEDMDLGLIFFLIASVFFYIGYLRAKEYEQKKEDREALHQLVNLAVSRSASPSSGEMNNHAESPSVGPSGAGNYREPVHQKYLWSTYPIAGVTFSNEDGSSRQKILKEICMGDDFGSASAWLEQYEYHGEDAIHVITDDGIVGNIQRRHVKDLLPFFDDAPDIMRVDAERFETNEGRLIYRADLTIGILRERL